MRERLEYAGAWATLKLFGWGPRAGGRGLRGIPVSDESFLAASGAAEPASGISRVERRAAGADRSADGAESRLADGGIRASAAHDTRQRRKRHGAGRFREFSCRGAARAGRAGFC